MEVVEARRYRALPCYLKFYAWRSHKVKHTVAVLYLLVGHRQDAVDAFTFINRGID